MLVVWIFIGLFGLVGTRALRLWMQYRRLRKRFPKPSYRRTTERPQPATWPDHEVTVTWIGHSTMYMNVYGVRILTDPVFSERVGVRFGPWIIGPRRYTSPALGIADVVGQVDVILLSHAHLDHLDMPSLKALASDNVTVVTAAGTGHMVRRAGFNRLDELNWDESVTLPTGMQITALPVRHWGRRYPWNRKYGWNGYIIDYQGVELLFGGDTAYTDKFTQLKARGHTVDLAFMPIGAYSPEKFQGAHCTPEQAWAMFLDSGAKRLVPMHWGTFVLSEEPVDEPMQRLLEAAGKEADRIVIRTQGHVYPLPVVDGPIYEDRTAWVDCHRPTSSSLDHEAARYQV